MVEDKKFILMNLDDERSKKIAEAISNPSCKKILDYIADNKEKSEEDISKDLTMPINTVEYNLKKLLESGLIEKSKNFFWSKRGKKINLYKPANRHIVISPKSKRPDMNLLKTIIPVILAFVVVIAAILLIPGSKQVQDSISNDLRNFNSMSELENFLKENQDSGAFYGTRDVAMMESGAVSADGSANTAAPESKSNAGASANDYSSTNIQVEGVDEADIVKNDGKYIYVVSGNKVIILNAFPAEEMEILSEINVTGVSNLFINGDKLIVLSSKYSGVEGSMAGIYDISDRNVPKLEKEVEVNGYYVTSRMIGDYVYLIANKYAGFDNPVLPMIAVDGVSEKIAATDIAYFPNPDSGYTFTNILAININNGGHDSKTYLAGASNTIYISENNIYLTYTKTVSYKTYFEDSVKEVFIPLLPSDKASEVQGIMDSDKQIYEKAQEVSRIVYDYSGSLKGKEKEDFDTSLSQNTEDFADAFQKRTEKTVIHKIKVDGTDISYITNGEIQGHLLNQYSMDEYKGNLRVATTTGNSWSSRSSSLSHMYVLDEDLKVIGSVEDLAKGEQIYSTRFMGDRAYMVTFKQVDPLFVIDLSDSENPEVLGQLKVTGFSSYLHPYDENHVIGIGKEASEEGRVQGLKIALFDVTDVSNPIEKAKYEVKQQWSDSNALYDPKAFLFNREKELLVLPVTYSEPTEEIHDRWGGRYWNYNYWQGAFVFKINTEEISLRGKIDHDDNVSQDYYWNAAVQRSLFMDDTLYTISQKMVKANSLTDLSKIKSVELPFEQIYYAYGMKGGVGIETSANAGVPDGAVA